MKNTLEIEGFVSSIRPHITPSGTDAFLIDLEHVTEGKSKVYRNRFLVALMNEMCVRANELEPGHRISVKGKLDTMVVRAGDPKSRRTYIHAKKVEVMGQ